MCIATVAQGAEQAKFEVVRPNNISPGAKQKPHFTGCIAPPNGKPVAKPQAHTYSIAALPLHQERATLPVTQGLALQATIVMYMQAVTKLSTNEDLNFIGHCLKGILGWTLVQY